MWVMTTTGFTSAVEHRDDRSLLIVRSRDKPSLLKLASDLGHESTAVHSTVPSDYPHRMIVTKAEYAQWCFDQVMRVDYPNFKLRAATHRSGDGYIEFLHRVWAAGVSLPTPGPVPGTTTHGTSATASSSERNR